MAFNPKHGPVSNIDNNQLTVPGSTGVILSQLDLIEFHALEELKYKKANTKALVVAPPPLPPAIIKRRIKREYYMEWWKYGNDEKDIDIGHFHSSNLKHFLKLFISFKKYNLIYLMRCQDEKVLWNRRARQ